MNFNSVYYVCLIIVILQVSLSFSFWIGQSTVCTIVQETCEAIWNMLSEDYVRAPQCTADWLVVSRQFDQIWNFPNCVGMYTFQYFLKNLLCVQVLWMEGI